MQALAPVPAQQMVAGTDFTREELDLIKSTVAPKLTDPEFKLFLYMARARGLNPIKKQIYAIKRWDSEQGREVMTIQTSIDGFRVIGERTGCYSPGREPTYREREDGTLISATAYVMKRTADGTWHEVAATAYWDEYKQTKKGGDLTSFWRRMPHGQLAKCAEALAIRKAFPDDTAGIYTFDEMAQADNGQDERPPQPVVQMPRRLSERKNDAPSDLVPDRIPADEAAALGARVVDVEPEDDIEALLDASIENAKAAKADEPKISEKDRRHLMALMNEHGHTKDGVSAYLRTLGFESSKDVTVSAFGGIKRRLADPTPLGA
jgi:phage recombination protein Bet